MVVPVRAAGGEPADLEPRVRAALAWAERFVLDRVTGRQREAMETALAGLREEAAAAVQPQFVAVPLLVHACVTGDEEPVIPLAAATSLLYLGFDTLDDLADGDLPERWHGFRPSEISLVAATLLCSVAQLIIAGLSVPAARRAAMQETLAAGMLRMSGGQHADLAAANGDTVCAEEVEAAVQAKSGEEVATFAALAARLAGAPPRSAARYQQVGRAIGTAGQLGSDCHDIFQAGWSRDLASGARTLPIALHLERLEPAERAEFIAVLERARTDRAMQQEVADQLRRGGELRRSAVIVELHVQRGLSALEGSGAREPARSQLEAFLRRHSFFSRK